MVIVLLGCWTSGKSTLLERLSRKHPDLFAPIDTDAVVSKDYAGFLYNVFLAHSRTGTAKSVNQYMDLRERAVLARLMNLHQSFVVAAGPLLVTREPLWSAFWDRVRPICFYLEQDVQEIYEGLKKRRAWQANAGLDMIPGFGSWDEGLLTRLDDQTGTWLELSRSEALKNVSRTIYPLVNKYRNCAQGRIFKAKEVKENQFVRNKLETEILYHLRLDTVEDLRQAN